MGNMSSADVSRSISESISPDWFNDGTVQIRTDLRGLQEENRAAVVTSLTIYKTPMKNGMKVQDASELERTSLPKPTFYHHFLVVEIADLRPPNWAEGDPVNGPLRIKAEKVGRDSDGKKIGIIVDVAPVVWREKLKVKFRVPKLGLSIPVAQLLEILTRPSPNYDILSSNCWNYANDTLIDILKAFGKLYPKEKHRMDSYIKQVPRLNMPEDVINDAGDAVGVGVAVVAFALALA